MVTLQNPNGPAPLSAPPYEVGQFTNREEAIEAIEELIGKLRRGDSVPKPVAFFWGVHGVGKSWLLHHLKETYSFVPRKLKPEHKGALSVFVDFQYEDEAPPTLEKLLQTLVKQIAGALKETDFKIYYQAFDDFNRIMTASKDERTEERLIDSFAELAAVISKDFVPLFIFDAIDRLEAQNRTLFLQISNLIVAVAEVAPAAFVLSSRRELRWKFELRRRIRTIELLPFNLDDTIAQVKRSDVYPYSYGHPFTNWVVAERLKWLDETGQPVSDQVLADLLTDVDEWIMREVRREQRDRLRLVATLRYFHIDSLRSLLAELEDKSLSQKPDPYFQEFIGELGALNLARWSREHRGYILDATVRRIMNRRLFLKDKAVYNHRHRAAYELYERWTQEMPENCSDALLEALYHLTAAAQTSDAQREALGDEIDRLLDQTLKPQQFDFIGANELVEQFKHDEELREMLGEYCEHVQARFEDLREKTHIAQQE